MGLFIGRYALKGVEGELEKERIDPEVEGKGPGSQKPPGSIHILALAPDRLQVLAFTLNQKFKCENQD